MIKTNLTAIHLRGAPRESGGRMFLIYFLGREECDNIDLEDKKLFANINGFWESRSILTNNGTRTRRLAPLATLASRHKN